MGVATDFSHSINSLFKRSTEIAIMRSLTCVKTLVASLLLGAAAVAWAATPALISSAQVPASASTNAGIIAFATTAPNPKSAYVVAAGLISNPDLEVMAWMDPFSSLKQVPNPGVDEDNVPLSVAATGLDSGRVVTADFDQDSILHIDTWTIASTGVVKQNGTTTPPNVTNKPSIVEITAVSSTEVVVAFQDPNSALEVEAWTIAADGLPTKVLQTGSGITLGGQFSITTVSANQVLTAAVDTNLNLRVSAWGVDSAGISTAPLSQLTSTGSGVDGFVSSSGPVSIATGSELESVAIDGGLFHLLEPVQSAFTPIIDDADIEVVKWRISGAGILSQTNTPSLSTGSTVHTLYVPSVGACMLPQGVQITAYGDIDGSAYAGVYSATGTPYQYNTDIDDPHPINNQIVAISAIPAGADNSLRDLFSPWNAYFVLGVLDNNDNDAAGTQNNLQITVLSYPMRPLLLFP
jgi:hypothetical protein